MILEARRVSGVESATSQYGLRLIALIEGAETLLEKT